MNVTDLSVRLILIALSAFLAGSYDEDVYGQVQQHFPACLAVFYDYHSNLMAFRSETMREAAMTESPIWQAEVETVVNETVDQLILGECVDPEPSFDFRKSLTADLCLLSAIENSVINIRGTFGKSMKAFELSAGLLGWVDSIKSS